MFFGMMVISAVGKKETMNNSELTKLIKDTAKMDIWSHDELVTLDYAWKWNYDRRKTQPEAVNNINRILQECMRRDDASIPLTTVQRRLLGIE